MNAISPYLVLKIHNSKSSDIEKSRNSHSYFEKTKNNNYIQIAEKIRHFTPITSVQTHLDLPRIECPRNKYSPWIKPIAYVLLSIAIASAAYKLCSTAHSSSAVPSFTPVESPIPSPTPSPVPNPTSSPASIKIPISNPTVPSPVPVKIPSPDPRTTGFVPTPTISNLVPAQVSKPIQNPDPTPKQNNSRQTHKFLKVITNNQNNVSGNTSTSDIQEDFTSKGKRILEQFGYNPAAGTDCEPYAFNEDTTLEKYLSDLKEQNCRQLFSPQDLENLALILEIPVKELNLDQARNSIYHGIINAIEKIQKNFETEDCLVTAAHASQVRNNALEYTRSLISPWIVSLLEGRDNAQYGGTRDEFAYFVGKYASENKTDICNKIIKGAQRPNGFYDTAAKIYTSINPFSVGAPITDIQRMTDWLQGDHTIDQLLTPHPVVEITSPMPNDSPFYTGSHETTGHQPISGLKMIESPKLEDSLFYTGSQTEIKVNRDPWKR